MKESITLEEISQKIRNYLFENYLFGYDENDFTNDSSFLDFGVLDSTGILELIMYIENEFDINISDTEIIPENMDSIIRVSHLIYQKKNLRGSEHEGL